MFGPRLAGPRLTLRPAAIRDFGHFRRWLADPEVIRYWWTREVPWTRRPMVAALVLFIGSLRPNVILWTIEHEDSAIGLSLIRQIDREKGRATVAVLIGERSEQRKGFALEAAAIRNDFAFGQLELRSLRATVRSENRASRRLLERAGYKLIGTAEDAGVGASGDALLFELQRSGHEQQRETAG